MFSPRYQAEEAAIRFGDRLLPLNRPQLIAILNFTPDSFYAASRWQDEGALLKHCESALVQGAACLDMGAYSSRPGAEHISEEEELKRLLPPLRLIRKHFPEAFLSVDTFRASVAAAAIEEGIHMINDISGGDQDAGMFPLLERSRIPYVLMHMRGTPKNMQTKTDYRNNLLGTVFASLHDKLNELHARGICDVVIDPGFGFAKDVAQNFHLLKNLSYFVNYLLLCS